MHGIYKGDLVNCTRRGTDYLVDGHFTHNWGGGIKTLIVNNRGRNYNTGWKQVNVTFEGGDCFTEPRAWPQISNDGLGEVKSFWWDNRGAGCTGTPTATVHQQLSEGWQLFQGGTNVQDAEVTVVMYPSLWTGEHVTLSAAYQFGGEGGSGQPVVTSISHPVFVPGVKVVLRGSGLDKAADPPLNEGYYMREWGFFEQALAVTVNFGIAPCFVVKQNDTYISCITTEKEDYDREIPLRVWVHGKGLAVSTKPDGSPITGKYSLRILSITPSVGGFGGGNEITIRGTAFAMRQEFFGEAIIEGEPTGEYMGAAKAFYDITLCSDAARCTLYEGYNTGGTKCKLTSVTQDEIKCIVDAYNPLDTLGSFNGGSVGHRNATVHLVVEWNYMPFAGVCGRPTAGDGVADGGQGGGGLHIPVLQTHNPRRARHRRRHNEPGRRCHDHDHAGLGVLGRWIRDHGRGGAREGDAVDYGL